MKHQKMIKLVVYYTKLMSIFRARNWVKINDESRATYNKRKIQIKTPMLRSRLCNYSDTYTLISGTIKTDWAGADGAPQKD